MEISGRYKSAFLKEHMLVLEERIVLVLNAERQIGIKSIDRIGEPRAEHMFESYSSLNSMK